MRQASPRPRDARDARLEAERARFAGEPTVRRERGRKQSERRLAGAARAVRSGQPGPGWALLLAVALAGCAGPAKLQPILATVPLGRVSWVGTMPVLHLHGSAYGMGYQHGSILRERVQASAANTMAFAERQLGVPWFGKWMVRRRLDRAWAKMEPFVPERYLQELKGLADGSGVPLKTLERIHAIPELAAATCASSAAAGPATADGRLIQIRNLDWSIQSGVQEYAAVLVQRPAGWRAFVNVGWLGFIGVVTGVNDQGISVGEIGAASVDAGLKGVPMPFLLRRVLEEADGLDRAAEIIRAGPRTVGYNYLLAHAVQKSAVALETTRTRFAEFRMNQEPAADAAFPVPNAIFRSDLALDPEVRDRQLACRGDPDRPGLESPLGSSAYEVRYKGQGVLLRNFHGRIDAAIALAIARAIAPASNIQSVVFAYPELWVAVAQGRRPAAERSYRRLDLEELL